MPLSHQHAPVVVAVDLSAESTELTWEPPPVAMATTLKRHEPDITLFILVAPETSPVLNVEKSKFFQELSCSGDFKDQSSVVHHGNLLRLHRHPTP